MAATPIYGKHFKDLLLRNWWTNFLETWYVASGTPTHYSLFKLWPWVDLDLFYGNVKFGNYGKKYEQWIFLNLLHSVTWKLVDADLTNEGI